jgi:hypothetical protein
MNIGAVPKHDGQQLACQFRRVNFPVKTPFFQQWNPSGMINVCMRNDNRINFGGVELKIFIADFIIISALPQAAINEQFYAVDR